MTIITWNIGGAKTLQPGADPTLMASYNVNAIDAIVDKLQAASPDVVAFQEIQKNESYDQAEIIAAKLGFEYVIHESFSWSHNEEGADLGNAIISKYPITLKRSGTFVNPNVTVSWEDGSIAVTHDKGYVQGVINIDETEIVVTTLHLTPFRKFGMELTDNKAVEILTDVPNKIRATNAKREIVVGDFNINGETVGEYLPGFKDGNFEEVGIDSPTTPKGNKYDHVLYKGLKFVNTAIDNTVLTDHYPVITTFEI